VRRSKKLRAAIETFAADVAVMPFDALAAARFGAVAAALASAGTPIGQMDAMIASHALALGATLVTNNETQFSTVRGLAVENWV